MPSSDRILRGARSAPGPAPAASSPSGATGTVTAAPSVLRGRARLAMPSARVAPPPVDATAAAAADPAEAIPTALVEEAVRAAEAHGYRVGRERAEAELAAAIDSAGALAARLEAAAPSSTRTVARTVSELALAVARRVIGARLAADPTILVATLEAAVGTINGSPEARVTLHPDAVGPVREAWLAAHGPAHLGKAWTFDADPSLPPGGCVLRFDHGVVDASLENQIEEIGIALDAALGDIVPAVAGATAPPPPDDDPGLPPPHPLAPGAGARESSDRARESSDRAPDAIDRAPEPPAPADPGAAR